MTAQASLHGVLVPTRDIIAEWVTVDTHDRLGLLSLLGIDTGRGWMLRLLLLALAIWVCWRDVHSPPPLRWLRRRG